MTDPSKSSILKSLLKGQMKTYQTYVAVGNPGAGPIEYLYQAPTDASDGSPCLVTQYAYNANNKPFKMKESEGVWVSATMDI